MSEKILGPKPAESKKVSFTVEEINQILQILNEIPAKYVTQLIAFIQQEAKTQLEKD